MNENGGKRLIKWAAESNSPPFHLVICCTLFPLGILHLADIQLCTNNQLSLQICGDSAIALCQAFSHFQWILFLDKKPRVTDNEIVVRGGIINPFYYRMTFLLMIQIGQTVCQLLNLYRLLPHKRISCLQRLGTPHQTSYAHHRNVELSKSGRYGGLSMWALSPHGLENLRLRAVSQRFTMSFL